MSCRYILVVVLSVLCTTQVFAQANLLNNWGFETAGTTSDNATYWEWDNPDVHGAMWGNAWRKDWRSHSGSWEGGIGGTWGGNSDGGAWQEVPAIPGATYTFTVWFWADTTWTNQADQGLKLEFYSGDDRGTNYISETRTYVTNLTETWVQQTVTAVAPTNAQWVRSVVWASDVGSQGALQFDDVELIAKEAGTVILISQAHPPMVAAGFSVVLPLALLCSCLRRRKQS